MEWMRDILEWTDRLSSNSMGRGWTGEEATQLKPEPIRTQNEIWLTNQKTVPGINSCPVVEAVEELFVPPTASTRADMGIYEVKNVKMLSGDEVTHLEQILCG